MSLVCIGNMTIDVAVRDGVRSKAAVGGDAAYAALAARPHLGRVSMLAPIGPDLPRWVLESLRSRGIGLRDLPRRSRPTIKNVVTYQSDGSRTWEMLASEAEFDVMSVYPQDVEPWVLESSGILLSAMSLESQLALTPWLRANSAATLYLDLQEDYVAGHRDEILGMVASCDVFLPSEAEATALAGTDDLAEAARSFQERGPKTVVIKRAERGCLVLDGDAMTEVAIDAVEPVDSTGAGDAFCGAFAAVHQKSGDTLAAVHAGAEGARAAIGAFGIAGLLDAPALGGQRSGVSR